MNTPFNKQAAPTGYKPGILEDIQAAVNELLGCSQIPPMILDGFMLRINAAFGANEILPVPDPAKTGQPAATDS